MCFEGAATLDTTVSNTSAHASPIPLVVDLDGTLTDVDTLHEAAMRYVAKAPLRAPFEMMQWLLHGKAHLKERLAGVASGASGNLPWSEPVLALITEAKAAGRPVILCTASDAGTAREIADHLSCFDDVIASDGSRNLSGSAKARELVARYGDRGFDYVGNAKVDLKVWPHAREAIIVSSDKNLVREAERIGNVSRVLPGARASLRDWLRQLRLHQWAKNLLLFVPLVAAQRWADLGAIWTVFLGFLSFGVIASTTYILNDLFDIEADRQHPSKKNRPLAAGRIPTLHAVVAVPVGLAAGLLLALSVGTPFLLAALTYVIVTTAYSMFLKRLVLIDVLTLAGLFTLRIVAGAVAISNALSPWLLMFSIFLFLSLAYLKRYVELAAAKRKRSVAGRGYMVRDMPVVLALGVGAGYSALVVLALYLFSDAALVLYSSPYLIIVAIPIMGYWLSYMWLLALRGQMHHDPVLHAVRDRHSLVVALLFFSVFMLGAQFSI